MAVNSNFMLKVVDAKLPDIQKALQQAGVTVRSIIEVFKEEGKPVRLVTEAETTEKPEVGDSTLREVK
ncbi:MAG: hypothetical protein A2Z09_02300 [Nitrospirae bacterium RBG_16_43_8]|nr:MAG: hypothetical protein A2Z09_02300 [Nitrospirae bacterium RBG_16_43_8]